jgi:pimeloyl-ACP methyl ester carboxylesterase
VCTTPDGWRLHLVRTRRLLEGGGAETNRKTNNNRSAAASAAAANAASAAAAGGLRQPSPPARHHPIILVPGLGSSGAYCFDLSPGVSLPDFLADRGWDVWTVELRGNGASDKPGLLTGRSRWWTVDTHVERDLPALLKFVLRACGPSPVDGSYAKRAHVLGHSMGGMALCGLMARADRAAARVRSVCSVGSGLFLEDSDWRFLAPMLPISRVIPWTVPSGALLRAYGNVMFTAAGAPPLDALYFVSTNVDHDLARAMMRRNWSDLSVGVVRQVASAFGTRGLLSADGKTAYADPGALGKVAAPALFICGDEDRMCPPGGAKRTADMWGAALVAEWYCGGGGGGSCGGGSGGRAERPGGAACPYGARFVLCGPGSKLPVVDGVQEEQRQEQQKQPQQQQQQQQRPPMLQLAAAAAAAASSERPANNPSRPQHFRDHYGHFDILMGLRVEREVFPAIARFFEDHDAPEMPSLMLATPPVSPRL